MPGFQRVAAIDDVGSLDRASPAKMIGASASNSAATASVHVAAQNRALRPEVAKRLTGICGRAPTPGARSLAMTAHGAQRLITRCSSPASAAIRLLPEAHSNCIPTRLVEPDEAASGRPALPRSAQ